MCECVNARALWCRCDVVCVVCCVLRAVCCVLCAACCAVTSRVDIALVCETRRTERFRTRPRHCPNAANNEKLRQQRDWRKTKKRTNPRQVEKERAKRQPTERRRQEKTRRPPEADGGLGGQESLGTCQPKVSQLLPSYKKSVRHSQLRPQVE